MAHMQTRLSMNPQYDRFLHATVGDDLRGTSVTVLTMLARLGVDPWTEASDLAAMPDDTARPRLEALMARFTDVPSLISARSEVVSRLLAVLPRGGDAALPDGQVSRVGPKVYGIPVYAIVAIGAALLFVYFGVPSVGS